MSGYEKTYLKKLYVKKDGDKESIIEPLTFQGKYFICEVKFKVKEKLTECEGILMLTLNELLDTEALHCTFEHFEEKCPEYFL